MSAKRRVKERVLPELTGMQLEIMDVFWDKAICTVTDAWRVINERRGVARNTVHTQIVRLEEKGWLRRRTSDGVAIYLPTRSRETTQQQCVRRLIETVFAGSADGLMLTLLENESLSQQTAERIQQMIDQAKRSPS